MFDLRCCLSCVKNLQMHYIYFHFRIKTGCSTMQINLRCNYCSACFLTMPLIAKCLLMNHYQWEVYKSVVCVCVCVFQNNIGHKLLVKQGWQAGQGLGKQLQGTTHLAPPSAHSLYAIPPTTWVVWGEGLQRIIIYAKEVAGVGGTSGEGLGSWFCSEVLRSECYV